MLFEVDLFIQDCRWFKKYGNFQLTNIDISEQMAGLENALISTIHSDKSPAI